MRRLAPALPFAVLLAGFMVEEPSEALPSHAAIYASSAVATDHALASEAGATILARGGTAADAAAAAMLALGVASPASSGFGGGGFALYYRASDQSLTYLDFRETAPAASTADMFERAEAAAPGSHPSEAGGLATGVPGEPAGIAELVSRFGRLPLRTIVAPAVTLARRGVPIGEYVARAGQGDIATALRRDRVLGRWFRSDAGGLVAGTRVKQPELARTLETFGRAGARAVYDGPIGRAFVASNRAHGGILTEADLRAYRVATRTPLDERHFGYRFVSSPPESAGGATMLASLDFLERAGVARSTEEPAFLHALAESWKGPYLDRQRYFGDPDHVDVPLSALASAERRAARASLFRADRAGDPAAYALPLPEPASRARTPDGGGTSHLCVVDAEGNVASVTTTINLWFGARYTAAGVILNDEMDDFAKAVGQANAFGLVGGERNRPGPGRRPVSSMSPTIVLDDRGFRLCVGAAGGSRIPTATEQVALRVLVRGEQAHDAIAAPRVHHQAEPNVLRSERMAPLDPNVLARLVALGHAHDLVDNVAVVQLVHRREDGRLEAASDPRKGGRPSGL